jgi:hypothetical protein
MIAVVSVPEGPSRREVQYRVDIAPEDQGGVYANFLAVWHTAHEFTLDFCGLQPPQPLDPEDETSPLVVPSRVVARVRIPVSVVFDVLRALNQNMTRYEDVFGPIKRVEPKAQDGESDA